MRELMNSSQLQARFRGALLGLAVGDALGTTLEFKQPGTFEPITDVIGGGPFRLPAGAWTDDTSMALCLAESLIETRRFDPIDQLQRYLRWYRDGHLSSTGHCFDIGSTTLAALHRFEQTGNPESGSTDPHSSGNGSLMRLAPVVLRYAANPEKAISYAAASSRTTHAAATAVDACRYLAALMLGAIWGARKDQLLGSQYTPVADLWDSQPLDHEIAEVAAGSFLARQPPEIRAGGYSVRTLEAALWAFAHSDTFADGALAAVNLGDDADTVGAVYGQLAGSYYGVRSIPKRWLDRLALRSTLCRYSENLLALSQRSS